ncbi:hypothetical protein KBC03_04715 [Patescibacteria group bacterium]|nr:hypothetical protein [Patescibacteria group bacterium]
MVDFIKDRAKETGSKILVDTKPKHIEMFRGVYLIKPNFKEFREMS